MAASKKLIDRKISYVTTQPLTGRKIQAEVHSGEERRRGGGAMRKGRPRPLAGFSSPAWLCRIVTDSREAPGTGHARRWRRVAADSPLEGKDSNSWSHVSEERLVPYKLTRDGSCEESGGGRGRSVRLSEC